MKVSDVSGVKISIMCNKIVTTKNDRCSHLFSCYIHICQQDYFGAQIYEIFEIFTNITLQMVLFEI